MENYLNSFPGKKDEVGINEQESLGNFELHSGETLNIADHLLSKYELLEQRVNLNELNQKEKEEVESSFRKIKAAGKKLGRFVLTRMLPAYMLYFGVVNLAQKKDGTFAEKERAKTELAKDGVTSEQKSNYKAGLSEMAYRGITPLMYSEDDPMTYLEILPHVIIGREHDRVPMVPGESDVEMHSPSSEDAWRMYLGLAQKNHTFGISDYKPEHAKDDKYYYRVEKFQAAFKHFLRGYYDMTGPITFDTPEGVKLLTFAKRLNAEGGSKVMNGASGFIEWKQEGNLVDLSTEQDVGYMLGHFTISCGQDEKGTYISYYDLWDLASPTEKTKLTAIGRPFEIYDRLYYDPQTGKMTESHSESN